MAKFSTHSKRSHENGTKRVSKHRTYSRSKIESVFKDNLKFISPRKLSSYRLLQCVSPKSYKEASDSEEDEFPAVTIFQPSPQSKYDKSKLSKFRPSTRYLQRMDEVTIISTKEKSSDGHSALKNYKEESNSGGGNDPAIKITKFSSAGTKDRTQLPKSRTLSRSKNGAFCKDELKFISPKKRSSYCLRQDISPKSYKEASDSEEAEFPAVTIFQPSPRRKYNNSKLFNCRPSTRYLQRMDEVIMISPKEKSSDSRTRQSAFKNYKEESNSRGGDGPAIKIAKFSSASTKDRAQLPKSRTLSRSKNGAFFKDELKFISSKKRSSYRLMQDISPTSYKEASDSEEAEFSAVTIFQPSPRRKYDKSKLFNCRPSTRYLQRMDEVIIISPKEKSSDSLVRQSAFKNYKEESDSGGGDGPAIKITKFCSASTKDRAQLPKSRTLSRSKNGTFCKDELKFISPKKRSSCRLLQHISPKSCKEVLDSEEKEFSEIAISKLSSWRKHSHKNDEVPLSKYKVVNRSKIEVASKDSVHAKKLKSRKYYCPKAQNRKVGNRHYPKQKSAMSYKKALYLESHSDINSISKETDAGNEMSSLFSKRKQRKFSKGLKSDNGNLENSPSKSRDKNTSLNADKNITYKIKDMIDASLQYCKANSQLNVKEGVTCTNYSKCASTVKSFNDIPESITKQSTNEGGDIHQCSVMTPINIESYITNMKENVKNQVSSNKELLPKTQNNDWNIRKCCANLTPVNNSNNIHINSFVKDQCTLNKDFLCETHCNKEMTDEIKEPINRQILNSESYSLCRSTKSNEVERNKRKGAKEVNLLDEKNSLFPLNKEFSVIAHEDKTFDEVANAENSTCADSCIETFNCIPCSVSLIRLNLDNLNANIKMKNDNNSVSLDHLINADGGILHNHPKNNNSFKSNATEKVHFSKNGTDQFVYKKDVGLQNQERNFLISGNTYENHDIKRKAKNRSALNKSQFISGKKVNRENLEIPASKSDNERILNRLSGYRSAYFKSSRHRNAFNKIKSRKACMQSNQMTLPSEADLSQETATRTVIKKVSKSLKDSIIKRNAVRRNTGSNERKAKKSQLNPGGNRSESTSYDNSKVTGRLLLKKKVHLCFSCVQCNQTVSSSKALYEHLCSGKRKKGFLCYICEKIFKSNTQLRKHETFHFGHRIAFDENLIH